MNSVAVSHRETDNDADAAVPPSWMSEMSMQSDYHKELV